MCLLRNVFRPVKERSVARIPESDLVVAAGGEFLSVRTERQREHGHGAGVGGRRGGMRGRRKERGERGLRIRGVEARALADPAFDEGDLPGGQGIVLLRHPVIGIFG